jgi:hypothetical protein
MNADQPASLRPVHDEPKRVLVDAAKWALTMTEMRIDVVRQAGA